MNSDKIQTFSIDQLNDIRSNLEKEIREASEGNKNSILYLKNQIPKTGRENGTQAQIIVIGGSNLISATATKEADLINIKDIVKTKLPNLNSKDIFLDMIGGIVEPHTKYLAINLGYPLESSSNNDQLDGKLLSGTKEHSFDGLVNQFVGAEIEKYFSTKRGQKIITGTANDTVCLILSGLSKTPTTELVGGIVGTGFNFGFALDENIIVNLESGNFDKFPQTDSGKEIDINSLEPEEHKFEKEISGGYLHKHYNYYANIFNLNQKNIKSTSEMDEIAIMDDQCKTVIESLYKRSASLVACQIAAIHDFKNHSKLTIHMEGSLFWKGKNYKEYVLETLVEMGIPYGKVKIEKIEKSYLLGAAKLVL